MYSSINKEISSSSRLPLISSNSLSQEVTKFGKHSFSSMEKLLFIIFGHFYRSRKTDGRRDVRGLGLNWYQQFGGNKK